MSIKFTNGPWHVRVWDGDKWPSKRISVGPEKNGIATAVCISPNYVDKDIMMADAKLISLAPTLCEALEPFANFACDEPCDCHNCFARKALIDAGYW